ncbi:MAG: hypothetical protein U0936_09005 [Planctomycetaceae bacterium]
MNGFTQRHRQSSAVSAALAVILLLTAIFRNAPACPFCLSPPQTLAEQISQADLVLIAELVRFEVFDEGTRPESTLRIRKYLRGEETAAQRDQLSIGQSIVISSEAAGAPGDLFLMFGTLPEYSVPGTANTFASVPTNPLAGDATSTGEVIQAVLKSNAPVEAVIQKASFLVPELISWNETLAITTDMVNYLQQLPSQTDPQPTRLAYFLTNLEHHDPLIAIDAWAEFGNASYADVVAVRELMSPADLRRWIADEDMSPERLGLYGMMLGLSGSPEDAQFLLSQMMESEPAIDVANNQTPPSRTFRFGAEGLMGGYLLLTGDEGLKQLEETVALPTDVPDTARHAFVQSLQFIWTYESDVISKARIQSSMRLLLQNSSMREIAITNLARWEDWESLPTLQSMFANDCEGDRESQRAILQFAESCCRSVSARSDANDYASLAEEFLCEAHLNRPDLLSHNIRDFNAPQ